MPPRASYFKGVMTVDDPDHGYKVVLTERQRQLLEFDILQQIANERAAGRHVGGTTIDTSPEQPDSCLPNQNPRHQYPA